ncbi:MAG: sporulation integral membrane protein YtvI [Clostridium sp.]|nr:sporulation integral membrane protein YtvI [Clostridium sp.]
MSKRSLYIKIAANLLIAILVILLCIYILPKLIGFFLPFVIGWIISIIANPLVRFMEKRIKIVRKHSSAIIIVGTLAGVIAILYAVGAFLVKELIGFLQDVPNIYAALSLKMDLLADKISGVYSVLPNDSRSTLDQVVNSISESISNYMANYELPSFSDAGNVVKNIADSVFSIIIVLLSSYFFIANRDKMMETVRKATPDVILEKFDMVANNFKQAIGGYFRAQFKLMVVVFAILWIGFILLGVDYSFLLALAVAFLDLLPFFGTGAVIGPWAVYCFIVGRYGDVVFLVVIYLLCQIIKQVLQPKMVGDSIGLSPLATLFFMFVGYRIGGLGGLILGIPIGMVIVNFYRSGVFDDLIRGVKILCSDLEKFLKF